MATLTNTERLKDNMAIKLDPNYIVKGKTQDTSSAPIKLDPSLIVSSENGHYKAAVKEAEAQNNPLLQTPALKVWKGDISLQQGIKEAKKQEELRTTIPSRTYSPKQTNEEIAPIDKVFLDSAKQKLVKGENLNASERDLIGKYGLYGISTLQTSEVFDLFASDNPQNTSRFEKIKLIKAKEDKGQPLTDEEKDFVETTKLINSLRQGYFSNLTSLTEDKNQNGSNAAILGAMDLYNDAVYEDDTITRNFNRAKLYADTGFRSYFEGNANVINAITSLITGTNPEDTVTGNSSHTVANSALKEYYLRNGEQVNSLIQDVAINMAQNAIPMLMSMAGGIGGGEAMAQLLSSVTMGPSVFGNAYKEGVQLGVNDQGKLLLYSSLVTASELSLEYLLGSVPNTAGGVLTGELLESVSKSVNNVLLKATIKTLGNGLGEFTEESIQGIISPLLQRYILGANIDTIIQNPIEALSESAYSGLVGFVTSVLTGGYSNLKNSIAESAIQQNGKVYNDIMQRLQLDIKDVASFFKETSQNKEVVKVANEIIKGDNSDLTVGKFITGVINDTKNSSNSFYATIGQKIFSIENGVETVLNTYESAVESGAIFPEGVGYLYNQTKENLAENNIDTVTLGEFAFKLQAKLPNAQIFGKLTEKIASDQPLQNGDEGVVAPVEEGEESDVSPQKERNIGFAEPDTKTIYREPTAQENDEAIFGKRKTAADFGGVDTTKGKHLNKAQQDEIIAIGEKLGRKVVYEDFSGLDKFKGKKKIPDGYLAKDGTVHINYFAKRPIYFLFKHEITHYLKKSLASYNDFMNLVIDSNAFKNWLDRNGYTSIDALKAEIMDTYSEVEGFDESRCYDEILANFVGEYLFGGENAVNQKLIDALEPKQKKTFMDVIHDIISYFKSKFQKNKPIQTEIEKIENEFIKVYKEAVEVKVDEATEESYSFTGYAEDGRGKYKSNFPKGTPKMAKADKILNYIQNVWSKKPIKLKIEENGSIKYIEAKFDPTYDESGNIPTDASKLMGGNRHGTSSEQRVTLDLADDYYQIASESQYNYSKDETGKDNPTHKDVTKWHYFINDIYFAEYDSNEYEPYRVSINVKEKVDGEYVYSFSAEKERESDTPRTLHAVVNDGNNPDANVELSNNKLTQPELIVKDNISEDGDIYSIPSTTNAESLLESYENGEISRQEYLNALRKEKTLNPLEIANLSERDADTTPEHAKKKGESKGNGESNTYNSLLESDIFDDTFKKEMKESSFVKKYATVTNEETLKTAAKELDEGGLSYVNKWWNTKPERASLIDTAVGFILIDRYQRIGDYQSAVAAAEKVREFGTASGQQVQIFSVLGRLDPNTMVVYAQKELSKAFDEMVKTRTQKWIDKNADKFNLTDNELEFIRRRTLQAAKLPEGRDKAIKLAEIATLLQDKLPPQKGEGLKTLQRMSMLLNAKTNIRNITGNAVMAPVFIFSDFFGSGIDKWVSTKTGVRTTGNFDRESLKGIKKGAFETMDDFRRHINTRNSEMNRFEIGSGKAFNEHHDGKLAKQLDEVAKILNALDRFTSFCLEMGDRPFYEMWFINSLNNQMKLNDVSEATPEMVAIASSEALQRTWQDTNKVVKAVAGTKNTLNYISIGGYGLGDVLIKFTKTPANLTKAIFDFSPAGLIKSIASDGLTLRNAVKKGSFKPKMQKQFVDSLSKGITGTLLYILAASLASAGVLGGGGDEDKDVSDFEKYIQGIPEYSFKFAGKWWSYEWMQPVGAIAATVTDYMKSKENNPDNNFFENTLEAIKAGGEVLYNQSFMKSIQNLFTADNIVDGLIDAILDDPSVYVPQLLSQVANVTDKYRRTTYEKNKPLENALNRVKVKIPGLRQTLPKSVDVLGREIPNSQKGIFNAFFNPANTFTDTSTPVTDHVYELYTKTKNKTLMPRVAPYSITIKGITKNFTPEEKNDFQRISGATASDILEIAFKSDGYKKLSDEQKVEFINDVYGFATKMAKSSIEYDYTTLSAMVGEYPDGKPILSESDYKKLPEEAKEMLVQEYFFNKTEIRFLDDYKGLINHYINQATE